MEKQQPLTDIHQSEHFEEYLQVNGFAASSRTRIKNALRLFALWCDAQNILVTEVSYNDVMAYVSTCRQRGNKAASIQKKVIELNHYYTFLLSIHEVQDNPCSNIEIKGVKRKTLYETFTTEELETMYHAFASMTLRTGGLGNNIAHKRNKIIVGLMIWQGLRTQELSEMKVSDVQMQQGKINVQGTLRTEGRELKLEAFQLYDMMDYINETRKLILALSGKQTDRLFISIGGGENFGNITQRILEGVRSQDKRVKEIKQIRASVITNWLRVHNIRKVQQMAGHRYVSSTESYQANNMDDLKEDVNRYHPMN